MKRSLGIVLGLTALAILAGSLIAWRVNAALESPLSVPDGGLVFEIASGASLTSVADELGERGIIPHPRLFRRYAQFKGLAGSIRAGEYRVEPGSTSKTLLDKFVTGDVQLYSLTVLEGWTFRDFVDALAAHPAIAHEITFQDWPRLLDALEAAAEHPEGLFLPETYRFPKGTPDLSILRQAFLLMQDTLEAEWAGRQAGLPLKSAYEALILASIIEKETGRADERARISGVFVRRLESGMRLQTDPTVIYGIGQAFDGNLTRRHLETDTPYNTYTRAGLPPTPIALPGREAIRAAVHPAPGNELYFVATGLGDGSHHFSETKEQHDAAVRALVARQRALRRRGQQ